MHVTVMFGAVYIIPLMVTLLNTNLSFETGEMDCEEFK